MRFLKHPQDGCTWQKYYLGILFSLLFVLYGLECCGSLPSKSSEFHFQSIDAVNTILAELDITYQNARGQNPDWLDISTDYWHTTC